MRRTLEAVHPVSRAGARLPRHRQYAAGAPLALAALLVSGLASGCSGAEVDGPGAGAPSPTPVEATPLETLDTAGVAVPRADPCEGLPETAVVDALGAPATAADRWADGEPARLSPGLRDVVHEWGCAWTAADGSAVQAWVFAPPLTPARAREVARAVVAGDGCRPAPDAPAFGEPTAARLCRTGEGGRVLEAAFSGLFGDAWLSCSVAAPRAETRTAVARSALLARAGAWCSVVLASART